MKVNSPSHFLTRGLTRNAAGKVFQAWKALVAAYSVDKIDELRKLFPGKKKLRGFRTRIEKVHWIVAVIPTTVLKPIAQVIGSDIDIYTNIALWIYEHQYNGPDIQGILSPYPNDDSVTRGIRTLINKGNSQTKPYNNFMNISNNELLIS
ncbi:MAG: PaREP1 family protein [Vulcanisaeta sp.]